MSQNQPFAIYDLPCFPIHNTLTLENNLKLWKATLCPFLLVAGWSLSNFIRRGMMTRCLFHERITVSGGFRLKTTATSNSELPFIHGLVAIQSDGVQTILATHLVPCGSCEEQEKNAPKIAALRSADIQNHQIQMMFPDVPFKQGFPDPAFLVAPHHRAPEWSRPPSFFSDGGHSQSTSKSSEQKWWKNHKKVEKQAKNEMMM